MYTFCKKKRVRKNSQYLYSRVLYVEISFNEHNNNKFSSVVEASLLQHCL